jgi:periplasmic protein CpxP/Spy
MSKKWLTVVLVGLLVLGTGTIAFATYGGHRGHGGGFGFLPGMRFGELKARLNLTPEQTSKLQELVKAERLKAFDQFWAAGEQRRALAKEIFKDNPSPAEVQRRVQELHQQHAQILNQIVAAGLEANKVFTPEQRAEIQKIVDEHARKAADRRDRIRQRMAEPRRPQPEQK